MATHNKHHGEDEPNIETLICDIDAESAVIGSMLIDPQKAISLSWLKAEWFTDPICRATMRGIAAMQESGTVADIVTVGDWLESNEPKIEISRVTALINAPQTSGNIEHYANIVLGKSRQRGALKIAQTLAAQAYAGQVDDGIALAMQRIAKLETAGNADKRGSRSYADILESLNADVEARSNGTFSGLRTGYAELDHWIGGIEPGALVLLAGRPGSGKSALGLSVGRRVAARLRQEGSGSVEVVTMEMSGIAQARRLVSSRGDGAITTRMMRQGFRQNGDVIDIQARQFAHLWQQEYEEAGQTLWFSEGVFTTEQIYLRAMQAKMQRNLKLLIIDQLDLCADEGKAGETERIGNISRALKSMAMRLGIVVLCLAQLNRNVESRQDHRPELADLRQSGRLEQDADIVMALYRPSYYMPSESPDISWYDEWAELIGLKCRDDQANVMMPLRFISQAAAYTDWDEERYPSDVCMSYIQGKESAAPQRKGRVA